MSFRPARGAAVAILLGWAGAWVAAVAWPATGWAAAAAPVWSDRGMVASPQADATRIGVSVLENGGNAIDAAIAVSLALSVSDGHHSGIGGGGFLLIRLADGRAVAVDARETAPALAHRDMYVEEGVHEQASRIGALSVGTPGLVAGLALSRERWGTRPWAELVLPAAELAEEGFEIGRNHSRSLGFWQRFVGSERFPETAAIQLDGGEAPREGWRLVQKDKGATLRRLAAEGPDVFYRGDLAKAMVATVQERGGILSEADLANYQPKVREPIRGTYRGYEVLSFPPPSSGGIALVEILNVLEGFELGPLGAGSSASVHRVAEAMKLAFADRAAHLGDSDFVDVPISGLTSKDYAAGLRARINPPRWQRAPWTWGRSEVALRVAGPGEPPAGGGTTHFSITDAEGNAVAVTQTINLILGSGITVPGTGIVLNDEMDDFSVAPDTPNAFGLVDTTGANAVAPGKRPLSSMTPTVVTKDGKPFMVTGSPGGPRIITTTLLSILNVIDWDMDVMEAVSAPRFHHQWVPDRVTVEPAFARDVVEALEERGHTVQVSERNWSSAQAIVVDPESGRHYGGSDPRSDGLALGP